jgi:tetratricopeptide (TPR) repeat protein
LRTTLDWSYDLLQPEARLLFARLSVFAGGCTLQSAEAVCGRDGTLLDQLATLVDESLVQQNKTDADEPRFSMLEIVREYARERLSATEDGDQVRRRHLEHFLNLAEEAAPCLTGREQITWFERLELEHENVRSALAYALESGDSASALRLVVAVRRFWQIHGHLAEGRQALEAVLEATPAAASELRANALNGAGILAGEQGDFELARSRFEAALDDARAVGATRTIANVLVNLGNLAFFRGEHERARDLYKESIEHFASLGDIRGQALAKENVGLLALTAGDPAEAVTWLASARELAREAGDDRELGAATRSLAAATLELGEAEETTHLLAESLALARGLGEPHGIAVCLEAFAGLAATLGEVERAATLFGASDAIRASIGAHRQPDSQILYERWLARTLTRLDTNTYSTRYEDGRGLTLDEACALALGLEPALTPASVIENPSSRRAAT